MVLYLFAYSPSVAKVLCLVLIIHSLFLVAGVVAVVAVIACVVSSCYLDLLLGFSAYVFWILFFVLH